VTRTITFATGNEGKLAEAREQLEPLGYDIDQYAGGYPEIQADTLQAVAEHAMHDLAEVLDPPFVLEDAGLFVDALDGFPGVYSSYVFGTLGNGGLLTLLADVENRSARFRSVVGYHNGETTHTFEGVVEGTITREQRGDHGFGFDPIFQPQDHKRTFAEMTSDEKTQVSHRSRALDELVDHLEA
jgi:XTP/dITP diphosphohydrolase